MNRPRDIRECPLHSYPARVWSGSAFRMRRKRFAAPTLTFPKCPHFSKKDTKKPDKS